MKVVAQKNQQGFHIKGLTEDQLREVERVLHDANGPGNYKTWERVYDGMLDLGIKTVRDK